MLELCAPTERYRTGASHCVYPHKENKHRMPMFVSTIVRLYSSVLYHFAWWYPLTGSHFWHLPPRNIIDNI